MTGPRSKSDALLAILTDAAKAGAPCPTNEELAFAIGSAASTPATLIHILEGRGVILRESHAQRRRITIAASRARTDWSRLSGNNHDRITRMAALESAVQRPKRPGLARMSAADLEARVEADRAAQEKRRARLRMPSHGAKIALPSACGDSAARRSDLPVPIPSPPSDLAADTRAILAAMERSYFALWLVVADERGAGGGTWMQALGRLVTLGQVLALENRYEGAENGGE